jgi:nucleoside-triphosphatase THEP1
VSDTLRQEVGKTFGMEQKMIVSLHRQNDKAAIKRLKKETRFSIIKKK